jgi:hypothetical protein
MIESDWLRYCKVVSRSVVRHQRLDLDQLQGVHGRCSDPEVATNIIAGFAESQRNCFRTLNPPFITKFLPIRDSVSALEKHVVTRSDCLHPGPQNQLLRVFPTSGSDTAACIRRQLSFSKNPSADHVATD